MKKLLCIILALAIAAVWALVPVSAEDEVIKVACVGDSITEGFMSTNTSLNSYPAQLQTFLDMDKYEVENFGIGGRTAMKSPEGGMNSYWNESLYTNSMSFNPNIVIIMLGTNDVVTSNWNEGTSYKTDLAALVESYKALSSAPTVYLATPPHAYDSDHPEKLQNEAVPIVKQVAAETGAILVDINALTEGMSSYFPDTIHPNDAGYLKLAQMFYENVFGGKVFDLTVLTESGNKVSIGGQSAVADSDGKVTFITGNGNKTVKIEESGVGFSYASFEVKGDTVADCRELDIPVNFAASATVSDKDGKVTSATDSDSSTGWQRTDGIENCWLQFDFGAEKQFNNVEIDWEAGTRPSDNGYKVEYSANGSDWHTLPNVQYSKGEPTDTVSCDAVTARYMKITCSEGTSGKYRPKIYECRVQKVNAAAFVPVMDYAEPENFDADRFELQTVSGSMRFVATNVYGDKIPDGKLIKADYTVTRAGETAPFTGTVYINKAYSSIMFGDIEIAIDDLKSGETEGYVTGVLFTNALPSDVIKVEFSLVDVN